MTGPVTDSRSSIGGTLVIEDEMKVEDFVFSMECSFDKNVAQYDKI